MIEQSGHETRDVTVGSSVQRHQLRQYLKVRGISFTPHEDNIGEFFRVSATPAQWEGINQWLQRTKVD